MQVACSRNSPPYALTGLERFEATAFAYCLMGNHYHVVVQTHRPNLSRLMRHVNGVYTRRHGLVGHLFQGRFKAILVDKENYFLEVCRYVDLNPVSRRRPRGAAKKVVTASARREVVRNMTERDLSERHALRVIGMSAGSLRSRHDLSQAPPAGHGGQPQAGGSALCAG